MKYQDKLDIADLAIDDDAVFPDERSGVGLVRVESCELSFQAKAGDSLFVIVTPGNYSLFRVTESPKISIEEADFNQSSLFEATCASETRGPMINIHQN